jgi:hypothetical protein
MNRLRPTSAADERSIAAKNGHADVVDATINRVLEAAPETSGEDCTDPTALAAWYDAPRKQSHPLDWHLSDCARWQELAWSSSARASFVDLKMLCGRQEPGRSTRVRQRTPAVLPMPSCRYRHTSRRASL